LPSSSVRRQFDATERQCRPLPDRDGFVHVRPDEGEPLGVGQRQAEARQVYRAAPDQAPETLLLHETPSAS
jgi:hypothetical protein